MINTTNNWLNGTNINIQVAALKDPHVKNDSVYRRSSLILSQSAECLNCHYELSTPYIKCAICDINICSNCFANGAEFLNHKNNHDYSIFDDSFTLFNNSTWTAKEENTMLDMLLEYGNFNVVSQYLPNRSVKDIKDHYDYYYLERNGSHLLPSFPKREDSQSVTPLGPYQFRLSDVDEPPRYNCNSVGFHYLAGYNAARSDFELEYDSNAEDLISNLNSNPANNRDPYYKVLRSLQCAIVSSYNRRLLERQRRKSIIRNHGIILVRKLINWLHRYDVTITRRVYERMCRFMQFYTGIHFEFIMEGLHRSGELKAEISRLCEFHKKGVVSLQGAQLYMRLKQLHEESKNDVKTFQNNTQLNWKVKHSLADTFLPVPVKKRGVFSPLEVVGLPGYEKLTPKEQDLCRNVRLVPLSYVEFRDILINESRKTGYLKLQTARRLLKIDVNKTRRLYDFLVEEGYINKV